MAADVALRGFEPPRRPAAWRYPEGRRRSCTNTCWRSARGRLEVVRPLDRAVRLPRAARSRTTPAGRTWRGRQLTSDATDAALDALILAARNTFVVLESHVELVEQAAQGYDERDPDAQRPGQADAARPADVEAEPPGDQEAGARTLALRGRVRSVREARACRSTVALPRTRPVRAVGCAGRMGTEVHLSDASAAGVRRA